MKKVTLYDTDRDMHAFFMALSRAAFSKIASPDYVAVDTLPSLPEDKVQVSLIKAWGTEMARIGFDKGFALAEELLKEDVTDEDKNN